MEIKYYKQIDMGGTHYYMASEDSVTHVNHLEKGAYIINNLDREGFEDDILGIYGGISEDISEEDFETALKEAIFELDLYKFIKTK